MSDIGKNLPTEILFNIFRHIRDGATMLDSVPLVCRRWNALAKDPRAWAGVCVKVEYNRGQCVDLEAPRILLRAPALHRVEFEADRPFSRSASGPSLETVLRQCHAPIREMQLGNSWAMSAPARSMLLKLIKSNQGTLRSFSGSVRGNPGQRYLMFYVMAQLKNLEAFTLEVTECPQYSQQFRGAFPNLRSLQFTVTNGKRADTAVQTFIPVDLLSGASSSLRNVDIRMNLHPDAVQAIRQCGNLVSLSVLSTAVSAVRGLTSLQSLKVMLRAQEHLPDDAEMPACGTLPALRSISVSSPVSLHQDPFSGPMLVSLARAAPNLSSLSVSVPRGLAAALEKDMEEVLDNLHHLRSLDLSNGSTSFLPRLLALPGMDRLSMELRVPSRDFENCCAVVKKLMGRVSDGSVRVVPIPFETQTFEGRKLLDA